MGTSVSPGEPNQITMLGSVQSGINAEYMGTSVSPGEPNQITMLGSVQIGIVLLVLTGVTTAKDVFRYEDEETGQSHYMTGDPGQSVEGGWKFTNGDGTFELTYKADEEGFQPTADHLP